MAFNLNKLTGFCKSITKVQLLALVATVLWVFGSLYFQYSDSLAKAEQSSKMSYEACLRDQAETKDLDLKICDVKRADDFNGRMANAWSNAFVLTFFPVPFAWLYGFIFITLGRVIISGSRVVINFKTLGRAKKVFACFCYFVCGVSIFFAAMVSMSIYVDYQVPVSIGFNKRIFLYKDSYVNVEGTWVRSHSDLGSLGNDRMNTSKVICHREKKVCLESLSTIWRTKSGHISLMSDINEYDIFSWTPNAVVYGTRSLCNDLIYTIDLNSKTVSGISKYADNTQIKGYCVPRKNNSEGVTYVLEDGYKVFRQEQDKVRPWLMRVVFSVFGFL